MKQVYQQNNYFVLTGGMGVGKSALLSALQAEKVRCIAEPARAIIAQQRSIEGEGVYEKDSKLFIELMLSRAIYQFEQMENHVGPVIFDRGIPDMIAYAHLAGLELPHLYKAAEQYRYNQTVFFMPAWPEIYTTDEERTMSFEAAKAFGEELKKIYEQLGYTLIDMPLTSIEKRKELILNFIS